MDVDGRFFQHTGWRGEKKLGSQLLCNNTGKEREMLRSVEEEVGVYGGVRSSRLETGNEIL